MKLDVKIDKTRKTCAARVEVERFSAVGKGYVAILTFVAEKPIFRVLRSTCERGAPSCPTMSADGGFSASYIVRFSEPRLVV